MLIKCGGGTVENSKTMKITFEFEFEEGINLSNYIESQIFISHFKLAYILLRNNREILDKISEISPEDIEHYYWLGKKIYYNEIRYYRHFPYYPSYHRLYFALRKKIPKKPIIDYKCLEKIENNKIVYEFEGEAVYLKHIIEILELIGRIIKKEEISIEIEKPDGTKIKIQEKKEPDKGAIILIEIILILKLLGVI